MEKPVSNLVTSWKHHAVSDPVTSWNMACVGNALTDASDMNVVILHG